MNINTRDMSFINFNGQSMPFVNFNGVTVYEAWKNLIANGVPPLTLLNCKGVDLIDYKLYGNSVQNGTPTPTTPVEVESVGERTKNFIDITKLEDGTIATTSGKDYATSNRWRTNFFYLSAGTYTSSIGGDLQSGGVLHKYSSPNDSSWLGSVSFAAITNVNGRNVRTVTLDEDCYVRLVFLPTGSQTMTKEDVVSSKPQLELNSVATDYESYYKIPVKVSNGTEEITTNIYLKEPLRKTGNYADYIDFENGKVVRNIKEIDMSTLTYFMAGSNQQLWATDINNRLLTGGECLCSTYSYVILSTPNALKVGQICSITTSKRFYLHRGESEVTPTGTMYYILETPIEEDIELPNIPTIKGTTILSIDTKTQPSSLEVVYTGKEVK